MTHRIVSGFNGVRFIPDASADAIVSMYSRLRCFGSLCRRKYVGEWLARRRLLEVPHHVCRETGPALRHGFGDARVVEPFFIDGGSDETERVLQPPRVVAAVRYRDFAAPGGEYSYM